ncbi:hypothetical protein LJK88_02300 [Paenibacillus sp. P26]|nr:hypothetical protein LJK88_02300 [Paenibacillus sp. P26]UUZ90993.1 hypothetical protein LJK87_35190 [Paenibacillus sp. P25]
MDIDLDMKMAGMSRGQEARVMLVLCLARRVPVILLDEPFAGIDVISREAIVAGLLDYLEQSGQSVLISTHDIQEVEGLFDDVVMMDRGRPSGRAKRTICGPSTGPCMMSSGPCTKGSGNRNDAWCFLEALAS